MGLLTREKNNFLKTMAISSCEMSCLTICWNAPWMAFGTGFGQIVVPSSLAFHLLFPIC